MSDWMMPTCFAPSSVQQNNHDFLLCMYAHKRKNTIFFGSDAGGERAGRPGATLRERRLIG